MEGVSIPDSLRERYPQEMTIVLQHQYWDLEVGQEGFSVTLSFQKQLERLMVPFAAVRSFADPSVNFALEFAPPERGKRRRPGRRRRAGADRGRPCRRQAGRNRRREAGETGARSSRSTASASGRRRHLHPIVLATRERSNLAPPALL